MSNKSIIIAASLVLASFVAGCGSKQLQRKETVTDSQVVVQTCDHCGTHYDVYNTDGSQVPQTIDWCYACGEIDEKGLDILIAAEEAGDDPAKRLLVGRRLFDYAEENFAFRAAMFRNQKGYETQRNAFEKEWELSQ